MLLNSLTLLLETDGILIELEDVLKYLEEVPKEQSLWEGECFVFDERVAVRHGLEAGSYDMCLSCGHPISEDDKNSSKYEEGISCPHCFDELTEEKKAKMQEKKRQKKGNG